MGTPARAKIFEVNQAGYTDIVRGTLRLAFVNQSKPIEKIAALCDVSIGTAKNWWEGATTPNGLYLMRMCAVIPELAAEFRRLTVMETEHEPGAANLASELHQLLMRYGAGR